MPKYTIEEFDKNMEEIRQRKRLGNTNPLVEKLKQAAEKRLQRIPRIGRR